MASEEHVIVSVSLTQLVAQQWKQVALQRNIQDDSTLAVFLLRHFQETQGSQGQGSCCQRCSSPLSWFCSICFTLTPKQQDQKYDVEIVVSADKQNITNQEGRASKSVTEGQTTVAGFNGESDPEYLSIHPQKSPSQGTSESDNKIDPDEVSEDGACCSNKSDALGVDVDVKFEEDFSQPLARNDSSAKTISGGSSQSYKFTCDVCMQVFVDPDLLTMHLQEHSDQMLHECGECKARFFQPHVLELHMKSHDQKKKYPCDQCDVFMSRLDNLNRHKALKHGKQNEKTQVDRQPNEEEETFKGVARFTCDQCKKGFARRDNLKRHLLTHSGEKRFGCQQCGAAFAYLNKLVTHMHLHSSQKPFQCGMCHKCFIDSTNMTKHTCRPSEPKHQCSICEKTFASSSQLILHSRLHLDKHGTKQTIAEDGSNKSENRKGEHSKDQNMKCLNQTRTRKAKGQISELGTPRSRTNRPSRNKGGKSVSPVSAPDQEPCQAETVAWTEEESHPHCCQFCGARFLFLSHLTRHQQKHTGEKAFKCSKCPVSCPSMARLQIHVRSHSATKDFPCQYCGKVLKSAYALKLHLCSHTGERPFKCEECGECFTHKSKYNDHMDVHAGERRHLCPYCGKSFLRSSNLSGHIRIHTHTKKVYPCQYCGRILRSRNTLREHLRSHTGEKPFKCDICGVSFMRSGTYKTHVRKHSGIKPHQCSFCGKSFLHPCHLRVHVRIHTGEKPYRCSQCPKAFSISASLKEHMRKHTGDKPFKCSVCGKGFAKSCNRLAHFRTHIKNQGDPLPQSNTTVG